MRLYTYRNDPRPTDIDMSTVKETGHDAHPSGIVGEDNVWYQPATLDDGRLALVVYSFSPDETACDELDNFPWDGEHQVRVQLAE